MNYKNEKTEKAQQTINSLDEIYRKSLQFIMIDKKEYNFLGNNSTKNAIQNKT